MDFDTIHTILEEFVRKNDADTLKKATMRRTLDICKVHQWELENKFKEDQDNVSYWRKFNDLQKLMEEIQKEEEKRIDMNLIHRTEELTLKLNEEKKE